MTRASGLIPSRARPAQAARGITCKSEIDLSLLHQGELVRRIRELDERDAGCAAKKFAAQLIVIFDYHVAESLRSGGTLRQAGFTATADALDELEGDPRHGLPADQAM